MTEKIEISPINKRSLIARFMENILECYDFRVYDFFTTIIGLNFFLMKIKSSINRSFWCVRRWGI